MRLLVGFALGAVIGANFPAEILAYLKWLLELVT